MSLRSLMRRVGSAEVEGPSLAAVAGTGPSTERTRAWNSFHSRPLGLVAGAGFEPEMGDHSNLLMVCDFKPNGFRLLRLLHSIDLAPAVSSCPDLSPGVGDILETNPCDDSDPGTT
jgi:hypothetical protein